MVDTSSVQVSKQFLIFIFKSWAYNEREHKKFLNGSKMDESLNSVRRRLGLSPKDINLGKSTSSAQTLESRTCRSYTTMH